MAYYSAILVAVIVLSGTHAVLGAANGVVRGGCGNLCICPNQNACTGTPNDPKPNCAWCSNSCVLKTTFNSDNNNCGGCNKVCSIPHAQASCAGGTCLQGSCDAGYADCNSQPGCETSTTDDVNNCGLCGNKCAAFPHAQASCMGSACKQGVCDSGYVDCDANQPGCETSETSLLTDGSNCGNCGNSCAQPRRQTSCVGGSCQQGDCDSGYVDCDANQPGCETSILTDVKNCGSCGNVCPTPSFGTVSCQDGKCVADECLKPVDPNTPQAFGFGSFLCTSNPGVSTFDCCNRCLLNQNTGCSGAAPCKAYQSQTGGGSVCNFFVEGGCANFQPIPGSGFVYTEICSKT